MARGARAHKERRSEILGVIVLAAALLLFLALVTDGHQGAVTRHIDGIENVPNVLGKPGAVAAGVLTLIFGYGAHVLYCVLAVWGAMLLTHQTLDRLPARVTGLVILTVTTAGFMHINLRPADSGELLGGAAGAFVGSLILPLFGVIGSNVIVVTCAIIGVLLATEFLFVRWFAVLHGLGVLMLKGIVEMWEAFHRVYMARRVHTADRKRRGKDAAARGEKEAAAEPKEQEAAPARDLNAIRIRPSQQPQEDDETEAATSPPFDPVPAGEREALLSDYDGGEAASGEWDASGAAQPTDEEMWDAAEAGAGMAPAENGSAGARAQDPPLPRRKLAEPDELPPDYVYPRHYTRPSLDLLHAPAKTQRTDWTEMLRQTSGRLEETLKTFGIEARVTDVTRGPTITRYELEPAPGIKVSRFLSLADDLALALKAHRVRVEAPIPGKGRVGIEVPNSEREPVVVRDLLESKAFKKDGAALPLALGKDIAGDTKIADLATMPHLLVAGATGAGKTVCVKSVLASLLFAKTPEELQLMLVDPKMVELSIFNDIPHLITPVVTDPKKAASALNWLIMEMEERYRLFAHLRVRNIEVYNESVENGEIEMPPTEEGGEGESVNVIRKLPYIVCIIDELADLMMLARSEVEDAIARLAQLARAVGIHLIIATQRPSVDVLTGVIKANFPARVSFQVSSRVDSRCILDAIGAERLIGRGDMLYLPAGQSKPARIQAAFVSDEEMNNLISYLKTQAPPQYRDEIQNFGKSKAGTEDATEESDELFEDAVRVVVETGQASISMVQRRLRVGYTRAARLIDMMEMKGIVGPHSGSKAREILVDVSRSDEVA